MYRLILLFALFFRVACPAQETNALQQAVAAFNARDVDGLLAACGPRFHITLSDHTVLDSRAAVEAWIAGRFEGGFAPFESIILTLDPEDMAGGEGVWRGSAREVHTLHNGKAFRFTSRWTAVLGGDAAAPRVAALHFGGNVFDNPILSGQRGMWKQLIIFAVLASAAVGAVLGAFAMRGSRRHRR